MKIRLGAFEFALSEPYSNVFQKGIRYLQKGATLFEEGDAFPCIALVFKGWISTTKSLESGETQLIDFGLPGDFLEPVTADGLTAGLTARAITPAKVTIVPISVWANLLKSNPAIADAVEHLKAAERVRFSERILRLGKGNAKTRIAYTLLEFCVRLDALKSYQEKSFHVPVTQSMIGDFTGLSTVHVCRMMGEFVQEGIIETDDHLDIHISNLKRLSETAGITADQLACEIKPELT